MSISASRRPTPAPGRSPATGNSISRAPACRRNDPPAPSTARAASLRKSPPDRVAKRSAPSAARGSNAGLTRARASTSTPSSRRLSSWPGTRASISITGLAAATSGRASTRA